MVARVWAATEMVVTVKLTLFVFAATVTVAGTEAAELSLDRLTTNPPAEARPFSVTVPVELMPPPTVEGFRLTEEREDGLTVSVACIAPPP